ncbi:unnamed protein product [Linum tenue]|uniref:Transmembrane protein n=1 Tax=Linum tenue TaxID=586396 RepID=A0AAV0N3N4_9ROSI|nr:unnamed protein product [Linum tenue]
MEHVSRKLVFFVVLIVFSAGATRIGAEEVTGVNNAVAVEAQKPPATCKVPCQGPRCRCLFGICVCTRGPPPAPSQSP